MEKANMQKRLAVISIFIEDVLQYNTLSDSVPLSKYYFAFLKASVSDFDGIAVSKEALGGEAGGGRGIVETALNGDKGLLSVIQHQPFYSSYSIDM